MNLKRLYDPALDAFVEETLAWNARMPHEAPVAHWTPEAIAQARDLEKLWGGIFKKKTISGFENRTIHGPEGEIPIRVYVPREVRGVYYDIHGGGFFMGSAAMDDAGNAAIAEQAKLAVVSVDYRLAPEHAYPAGPDDCEAAALWLLANAKQEFGSEKLLIGGGSAGANLVAVTLVRLRDRHDAAKSFVAANLVFGVYDVSGTPSQRKSGVASFRDLYVPDLDSEARRHPDVSPLYAELHDLPPALFTVGTADYLYDDSLFMAARWRAAGNEAEIAIYPESVHGFTMFPTKLARVANERIQGWLTARVNGA